MRLSAAAGACLKGSAHRDGDRARPAGATWSGAPGWGTPSRRHLHRVGAGGRTAARRIVPLDQAASRFERGGTDPGINAVRSVARITSSLSKAARDSPASTSRFSAAWVSSSMANAAALRPPNVRRAPRSRWMACLALVASCSASAWRSLSKSCVSSRRYAATTSSKDSASPSTIARTTCGSNPCPDWADAPASTGSRKLLGLASRSIVAKSSSAMIGLLR